MPAPVVVAGAQLSCTMGLAPSVLVVPPLKRVLAGGPSAANILDHKPMMNVVPFGMCRSLANPSVASATSSASGVLTPMPCIPVIPAPWTPGSPTVLIGGQPSVTASSKCLCAWAGVISVIAPGGLTVIA